MDDDAEKVIAISLGKIATSRVQRGGPNLHRSLLVANVLYKARTSYFDDALQTKGASLSSVVCAPCPSDDDEVAEQVDVEEPLAKPNRMVTPPVTSAYEDCASTDGGDDKENVEPPTEASTPSVRYLKRRRAHAEDEENGAKRGRLWRRSSSCDSDDSDQDDLQEVDAMEVESNLVLAFNSGLKGLSSSWDNCQPSLEEPQLRRGASLPDMCAAQSDVLRTAFSPPVLALTV